MTVTDQGIVTDYSSYPQPDRAFVVLNPASGEETARIDLDDESSWSVYDNGLLVDLGSDDYGFAVLDAAGETIGDEVRADDFERTEGGLFLRTGRRIVAVDQRTLEEGDFEFEADAEVTTFAAVAEGLVVVTVDGLVGVSGDGNQVWTLDTEVGPVGRLFIVGEDLAVATGDEGTALFRFSPDGAEVVHRETTPYRVVAASPVARTSSPSWPMTRPDRPPTRSSTISSRSRSRSSTSLTVGGRCAAPSTPATPTAHRPW